MRRNQLNLPTMLINVLFLLGTIVVALLIVGGVADWWDGGCIGGFSDCPKETP